MSFVCSIHGYYSPTPGTTLAICPECQAQGSPILANEGLAELEAARSEITRLRASLAAAEAELARVKGELRYDDADRAEGNYLPASAVSRAEAETEALRTRIEAVGNKLAYRAERACTHGNPDREVALREAASLIHTTLGSSDE